MWGWGHPWADYFARSAEAGELYKGLTKSQHRISDRKIPHFTRPNERTKKKIKADPMSLEDMRSKLGFSI